MGLASFFSDITWKAETSLAGLFMWAPIIWWANPLPSLNGTNSNPTSVFVMGTTGETTTQSWGVAASTSGHVESMFS